MLNMGPYNHCAVQQTTDIVNAAANATLKQHSNTVKLRKVRGS